MMYTMITVKTTESFKEGMKMNDKLKKTLKIVIIIAEAAIKAIDTK